MIYLYGLLEPGPAPALPLGTLRGVTGPVEVSELPEGWLIHGPADEEEILPRRRNLLAHTRVLEACLGARALLPMRFGMVAADLQAVGQLIASQQERIVEQADKVRGHVELGVRVGFPREAALSATIADDATLRAEHARLEAMRRPPHFQVAEFGRRLAEALDRRRTDAQRRLIAALSGAAADHVISAPESDVQVLAMEALLPRGGEAAFTRAVETASESVRAFAGGAEPVIRIVGPVPAFNFVRLTLTHPAGEAA